MLAHQPTKHQTWHAGMHAAASSCGSHSGAPSPSVPPTVHGIVALVILSRHVSAPRQQQLQAGQVVLLSSLQTGRTGKDIWAG
jgi:hypothetical protein